MWLRRVLRLDSGPPGRASFCVERASSGRVCHYCLWICGRRERASWHVYLSSRAIKGLQVSCHDTGEILKCSHYSHRGKVPFGRSAPRQNPPWRGTRTRVRSRFPSRASIDAVLHPPLVPRDVCAPASRRDRGRADRGGGSPQSIGPHQMRPLREGTCVPSFGRLASNH